MNNKEKKVEANKMDTSNESSVSDTNETNEETIASSNIDTEKQKSSSSGGSQPTLLRKLIPQLVSPSKRSSSSNKNKNTKSASAKELDSISSKTESISFLKCNKYKPTSSKSTEKVDVDEKITSGNESEICIIKPMALRPQALLPRSSTSKTADDLERPSSSASLIHYQQQQSHRLLNEEGLKMAESSSELAEASTSSSAFQAPSPSSKRTLSQAGSPGSSSEAEPIHMTLQEVREIMFKQKTMSSQQSMGENSKSLTSHKAQKLQSQVSDADRGSSSTNQFRSSAKLSNIAGESKNKKGPIKRAFDSIRKQTNNRCNISEADLAAAGPSRISDDKEHEQVRMSRPSTSCGISEQSTSRQSDNIEVSTSALFNNQGSSSSRQSINFVPTIARLFGPSTSRSPHRPREVSPPLEGIPQRAARAEDNEGEAEHVVPNFLFAPPTGPPLSNDVDEIATASSYFGQEMVVAASEICSRYPFLRRALPPLPSVSNDGASPTLDSYPNANKSSFRFNMMAEERDELEGMSAGPPLRPRGLRGLQTSLPRLRESYAGRTSTFTRAEPGTLPTPTMIGPMPGKKALVECFTCHMVHRYICPPVCAKKSFYDQMPAGVLASAVIDRERQRLVDYAASIERVKDCGWYWGPITGEMAEKLLETEPSGSFVVRDSSDEHYIFSLTFKLDGMIRHVRIEHSHGNFSFGSLQKFRSSTIVDFIENAMLHSRSGRFLFFLHRRPIMGPLRVQLLYPVSRFKKVQSLQHNCRFVILKHVRRNQVSELPLPDLIKEYLDTPYYYSEELVRLHAEMEHAKNKTQEADEKRKECQRMLAVTKLIDPEQVLARSGYNMPPPADFEALDFLRPEVSQQQQEPEREAEPEPVPAPRADEPVNPLRVADPLAYERSLLINRLNEMLINQLVNGGGSRL